jgi:hypothetical protein
MKNLINCLIAYGTEILIHLINLGARKVKKKIGKVKVDSVEANKS